MPVLENRMLVFKSDCLHSAGLPAAKRILGKANWMATLTPIGQGMVLSRW